MAAAIGRAARGCGVLSPGRLRLTWVSGRHGARPMASSSSRSLLSVEERSRLDKSSKGEGGEVGELQGPGAHCSKHKN